MAILTRILTPIQMPDIIQRFLRNEQKLELNRRRITPARRDRMAKSRPPEPRGLALSYASFLVGYQREINKTTRAEIVPVAKTILQTTRQDSAERQDGFLEDLITLIFEKVRGIVGELLGAPKLIFGITRQGERINAFNNKKYSAQMFRILGLNDLPVDETASILSSWNTENLQLIKGVNSEQISKLETLFLRSTRDGARAKSLVSEIARVMKSSTSRAALIAVDQTNKLNGQMDRLKQTNAGVDQYIWRTSQDERVRPLHAQREGIRFSWDKPPSDGHPGQPVRCRCTAEPDIEHFLDPKEAREKAEAEQAETLKLRKEVIAKAKKGPLKKRKARPAPTPAVPRARPAPAAPKPKLPKPRKDVDYRTSVKQPRTGKEIKFTPQQSSVDQLTRSIGNDDTLFREASIAERAQASQWSWVHGSKRKMSIITKEAVAQEFKLKGIVYNPRDFATPVSKVADMRETVRAVYSSTQEQLKARGIKTVRLYRGVEGNVVKPGVLESWTTKQDLAEKFGDRVLIQDVPINKIYNYRGSTNWVDGIHGNQAEFMVMT